MATLYNSDLKPLESGTYTHYYDHATKLFLADNFRLAPKQQFLYYVCINIDQSAVQSILPGFGGNDPASSQTLIEQYETGLLAKRVELPRFNVQTRTFKSYNRKNIVQTGIAYDPITITFHDDAADVITKFWNDFYTYYYRDSDYDPQLYNVPHKYEPRAREGWGFSPRNNNLKPFLRNIQIFSLHNKRFTEYLLINPLITNWRHGEHNSAESNGLMESNMTVEFETVKYRTGYVNPVDVNGFATIHYDNYPSPISNSVTNIFTDAGLVGALAEGSTDLARPDGTGSGAGILGSVLAAYRFYNNLKDVNFSDLAKLTIGQMGSQILGGVINGVAQNVFFPTLGGSLGYGVTYAGSQTLNTPGSVGSSPYALPGFTPAATINGQAVASNPGRAVSLTNSTINDYTRGVQTTGSQPGNPASSALYSLVQSGDTIAIDGRTGQPATSQLTTYLLDNSGQNIISQFQTTGDQTGTYNSSDRALNLKYIQQETDAEGKILSRYQYTDDTIVWFNESGDEVKIAPGNKTNTNNLNTNPTNTRDLAIQGQTIPANTAQYYTDPTTGITRVVNGGTSGLVRNTLSGTVGSITGLAIGSKLYGGLSDAFGGGVIGKTVAAGITGVASTAVGIGVNNLVQTGLDYFLGTPGQSFNPVTGKINNMVGSTVGTGAYTSQYPNQNILSSTNNGNGTRTYQTADGGSSVVNVSDNSIISSVKGAFSGVSNWLGSLGQNRDSSILLPEPGGGYVVDGSGNPISTGFGDYLQYGSGPGYETGTLEAWNAYEYNDLGSSWDSYFESNYAYEDAYFGVDNWDYG